MKRSISYFSSVLVFSFVLSFVFSSQTEARDLTYKIGAGYKQLFTNGFVLDKGRGTQGAQQLNGLVASYGAARNLAIGGYFGFTRNLDAFIAGPSARYYVQSLIYQDPSVWKNLNLFTEVGFYLKTGGKIETGILVQTPSIGFEILPFDNVDFAIEASAGVVVDLLEDSMIGFTNGMFGDVGLRFYF